MALIYLFFVLKKVEKIGYHSNFNFECNTEIILKIVGFMVILRLSFSSYDASENEWIVTAVQLKVLAKLN